MGFLGEDKGKMDLLVSQDLLSSLPFPFELLLDDIDSLVQEQLTSSDRFLPFFPPFLFSLVFVSFSLRFLCTLFKCAVFFLLEHGTELGPKVTFFRRFGASKIMKNIFLCFWSNILLYFRTIRQALVMKVGSLILQ